MNGVSKPVVLVGVSGSRASAAALRWAVDEAARRSATLRVVQSWDPGSDLSCAPYAPVDCRMTPVLRRDAAGESLAAQLREMFGPVIPGGIQAELAEGPAERTLVSRSAGADLLVLGSASPETLAGRPIGPVIRACLSHALCPVVVVRFISRPASVSRSVPQDLNGVAGLSADLGADLLSAGLAATSVGKHGA